MADDRKPKPGQRGIAQDRTETTPADGQRADGIRESIRNPDADDDSQRDASNVVNRRTDEISDS